MSEIIQSESFVPEGRALPPERGWNWIVQGWNLFKRQPGVWIVMILLLFVIFVVAAMIPFAGSLAMAILLPVFSAGFVIGARALDTGGELEFAHLFAGFRDRFGVLATVGAIYLAGSIVIALAVVLVTGASMSTMMGGMPTDPADAPGAAANLLLALLIMAALMIPLVMAVWFAAPLVVFHERSATDAMKESFAGCLKNIVPFLIYGVVLFIAAILASMPMGLGWLVLGPVSAASIYTAYRDIYFTA